MTDKVNGARILVADDQPDVARTLCSPLRKAGAQLRFVRDGHSAIEEITARPVDLLLVDMKMPPEEWGGLWLLRRLNLDGWRIPTLVLSGEGSKQQVIQAMRLGTADWIDKDSASDELLFRCGHILAESLEQSLDLVSTRLPTPLAFRFARYARAVDPEKQVTEGLHALEAIFRFASVLGFSNPVPAALSGIPSKNVARPSMGTWFTLCTALAQVPGACTPLVQLLSWLIPERIDRQTVQDLIKLRNDIAHGRAAPTTAHRDKLDLLLRRFAHRAASSWRAEVVVPTSMTYDGSTYKLDVLILAGAGKPSPGTIQAEHPQVTGRTLLFTGDMPPLCLFPWLIAQEPAHGGTIRCFQFDGAQHTQNGLDTAAPLKYAKADDSEEVALAGHALGTWEALATWFPEGADSRPGRS